ncbi:MAG: quinonprotein alcohol dehydrogenase [Blastopirellula sp.]|nr:MAG: quinonprotein alcohol dehydrogenase [Blastopirellula sp.]
MKSLLCLLLTLVTASFCVADENWAEFRGSNGDGISTAKDLPVEFDVEKNLKWKLPLKGKAHSSPVIWGNQLWITNATEDGKQMFAICLDRMTGKVIHDLLVFENAEPRYREKTNSYASCTPAIEEGRIYLHFGSYGTTCVDTATGKKLWERRDIECDHWRGPGSSPVIDDKNLYVAYDGYDYQFALALDKKTGKTVWKKDRDIDYGTDNGDRKKAYSTATILEHKGRRQVVMPSAVETITYDPATGDVLWRVRHGGMNAAARPLYQHGLVYISAGSGEYSLIAVKPEGTGDITDSSVVWNMAKGAPKRPSQIIKGDLMFMIEDKGVATCLNAKTGELIWQQRVGGNYRASLFMAADNIYSFSQEGKITVFKAKDEYEEVAVSELDTEFQASPAVAGNQIYLKSVDTLYCFEK